ncbi:MAG: NAD-dependent epimerase/dehydratase family protein, partial [Alphaproteobacteria bacterium]|nr:NAD-dependent epimerase/dehydratase family protein [Alphaproteobacteria bacterium]
QELDLRDAAAVRTWMVSHPYDLVIHAAAKVGGIKANIADPAGFLYDNMAMGLAVVQAARATGVQRLIYLGSSCMYPKDYGVDLREEHILAAPLEPTNEGYALAKISTARFCDYVSRQHSVFYRTIIPCNLYGMGDHFNAESGHLIAAAILKIDKAMQTGAETVEIWGDGMARREFMYVDDLADFLVTFGGAPEKLPPYLNVGLGQDYTVNEYYAYAAAALGFTGRFTHKRDAPVGMMKKLMDSSRARALGWAPRIDLASGIAQSVAWFKASRKE